MEISEITEKDSIGLDICCRVAAGNAAESAGGLGISEVAKAGAGGDVEGAAENIF